MGPLRFCFALHLHQPWGNFDSVFEEHLEFVYRPLLRGFMAGELWPVALHISGPLLEWLEAHAPRFLDEIGEHATAQRLELLAAGHDEPILAVLSREDRLEQVLRHRDRIRSRFGVDACGLWLTERVWEPTLPEELAAAGVRFVLVDDRHFRVSGFASEQLHAHFVTEASGQRVAVFPIDEKLRYLVPFRPPAELADYFRAVRAAGHHLAVFGDDGEKFGGWPGTRKWLYEEGWLEAFLGTMRELRDTDEVRLSRFEDALTATPPGGLAYLPSASYREMEGWSLPFEPARALLRLERDWDGARIDGVDGSLLRGGHWRHFLVKYPESNRMHKVMLTLSAESRERGDPAGARRAIGRAQCNDAYWHGVFGGLYLPFLRGTVWSNLADAESVLRDGLPLGVESWDIDADGRDEIWIRSPNASVLIAPARGGMVDVWLDLTRRENLLNVVARHRESYHEALGLGRGGGPRAEHEKRQAMASGADDRERNENHDDVGGAPSIHDLETQLPDVPPVDTEPRGLFIDRILAADATRDDFLNARVPVVRSWAGQEMAADWDVADAQVDVHFGCEDIEKSLHVEPGLIAATWRWNPADFPVNSWFSTELSFSVPLTIEAPGADGWDYAVETVAKSEKGFERMVQGTAVVLRWAISAGHAAVTVTAPPG
jgi:4-alpha-glucanotransferase